MITKIISGGQTGADIGALEAAIYCEVPHGGYCPKGRRQEKGKRIPAKYNLVELDSPDYLKRTEANVVDSDATLIFTYGEISGGSLKTQEFAKKHNRPVLHVAIDDMSRDDAVGMILMWIDGEYGTPSPLDDLILNVAGSRESKAEGIQNRVMAIMVDVLRAVNSECKRFYPLG